MQISVKNRRIINILYIIPMKHKNVIGMNDFDSFIYNHSSIEDVLSLHSGMWLLIQL